MLAQLSFLFELVAEIRANNSVNEKKIILKKYYEKNPELFNKFFDYIYSFNKRY
jgi:hypothetical protein